MTSLRTETLGPVRLVVTDRRNGVSPPPWDSLNLAGHVGDMATRVAENRDRVAHHLGVREVAAIDADHGSTVHHVASPGQASKGDALVSTRPGLGLLALSADCVAAAIAAPDVPAVAVFHCGWRGLPAGIVPATIAGLAGLGADPGQLQVRLGPAICPRCYEVSPQVSDAVAAAVPAARATSARGRPAVDLVAGVVAQLEESGVAAIRTDGRCTAEDDALYSHRRDRATGRQGVLAVLEGAP